MSALTTTYEDCGNQTWGWGAGCTTVPRRSLPELLDNIFSAPAEQALKNAHSIPRVRQLHIPQTNYDIQLAWLLEEIAKELDKRHMPVGEALTAFNRDLDALLAEIEREDSPFWEQDAAAHSCCAKTIHRRYAELADFLSACSSRMISQEAFNLLQTNVERLDTLHTALVLRHDTEWRNTIGILAKVIVPSTPDDPQSGV